MQNHDQKSYNELLAELQQILQSIERGDSTPDQWEAQLLQAQILLENCRQRLRRIETKLSEDLTTP